MRGGTENVPCIAGIGKACELALEDLKGDVNEKVKKLRDELENEIIDNIPGSSVNGNREHRVPNTTSISFDGIEGDSLLLLLNENGISASTGSACNAGKITASRVLMAMGISEKMARGTIRLSLSRFTSFEEVEVVSKAIRKIVSDLRKRVKF